MPPRRTAEMGARLNHPAFFPQQTHFLDHYQRHNSHICLLQTFKRGDSFTKWHGLPPLILAPLYILFSSLLLKCSLPNLFFTDFSHPFKAPYNLPHLHTPPPPSTITQTYWTPHISLYVAWALDLGTKSPTYWCFHSSSLSSTISSHYQTGW